MYKTMDSHENKVGNGYFIVNTMLFNSIDDEVMEEFECTSINAFEGSESIYCNSNSEDDDSRSIKK
jgi:hypothetical protein